VFEIQMINFRI